MVEVTGEPLPLLRTAWTGLSLPIPVATAHGEGRALFTHDRSPDDALRGLWHACTCDNLENDLSVTEHLSRLNPNGSPGGHHRRHHPRRSRFTVIMPHPERVFRTVQHSWAPAEWGEDGGWLRLFRNARAWLG